MSLFLCEIWLTVWLNRGTEGNANEGNFVSSAKQLEQDGEQSLDANKENKEGAANEVDQKGEENKVMILPLVTFFFIPCMML